LIRDGKDSVLTNLDMEGIYPSVGRKTPASGAHIDLGGPNIFFVTVNAKDRTPWIAQDTVQKALEELWRVKAMAWRVGYCLLMPDHLHFFCAPYDLHHEIDGWITFWKRDFSRYHGKPEWQWHRRSFHHRMRDRIEYEEKLSYVAENPLRKNLVKDPRDWKFQGRVHDVQW
jgi:putative transposase